MKNYILILASVLCFGGCGPEVLTWDEEVLLNTGETIIVHREATYTLSGSGDNPFKMSMHPRRWDMVVYFYYHGKRYSYVGDAVLFLLAISPQGTPNLIIYPEGFSWDTRNNFNPCAAPYYGQLTPDTTGEVWSFPENVDPWLYGLRGNLNRDISYEKIKSTDLIKHGEISLYYARKSNRSETKRFSFVDPEHKSRRCGRGLSVKVPPRDFGLRK